MKKINQLLHTVLDKDFRENIISGQIFLRDANEDCKKLDGTNRKLMMVVGILAVPDCLELKGEHQYNISGMGGDLTISKESIDLTELAKGSTAGSLLLKPIWRI